jgi:nucleoside phosphorylase
MKILIICATYSEARSSIEGFNLVESYPNLWTNGSIDLLITLEGSLNAALAFQRYLHTYDFPLAVLNLGCCATLNNRAPLSIFSISLVKKAQERDLDTHSKLFFERLHPSLSFKICNLFQPACLISLEAPLHDGSFAIKLQLEADLVDMEGYSLSHVAKAYHCNFSMIKCVSDFAKKEGQWLIQKHLKQCSEHLHMAAKAWIKLSLD